MKKFLISLLFLSGIACLRFIANISINFLTKELGRDSIIVIFAKLFYYGAVIALTSYGTYYLAKDNFD